MGTREDQWVNDHRDAWARSLVRETPSAETFDAFFRAQFARVARTAALIVRNFDLGEDLAQESFSRLLERWDSFESEDHARNYVFKTSMNLCRSYLRRSRRLRFVGLTTPEPISRSDGLDEAAATVRSLEILDALKGLSFRQRACVVLVDYVGLDSRSVGDLLEMRPGTVRINLMRGRRALRSHLSQQETA